MILLYITAQWSWLVLSGLCPSRLDPHAGVDCYSCRHWADSAALLPWEPQVHAHPEERWEDSKERWEHVRTNRYIKEVDWSSFHTDVTFKQTQCHFKSDINLHIIFRTMFTSTQSIEPMSFPPLPGLHFKNHMLTSIFSMNLMTKTKSAVLKRPVFCFFLIAVCIIHLLSAATSSWLGRCGCRAVRDASGGPVRTSWRSPVRALPAVPTLSALAAGLHHHYEHGPAAVWGQCGEYCRTCSSRCLAVLVQVSSKHRLVHLK